MTIQLPLNHTHFSLDASGVAGFFGGDEAVSAMATVHIYEGRKWLGWYNSPGSYNIAKRYGQLSSSRFWQGLFPGVNVDPAALFELDGQNGPKYQAAHSGTILERTGHLGFLFSTHCQRLQPQEIEGRRTSASAVTIALLNTVPDFSFHPKSPRSFAVLLASIPIIASISTCIVCAIVRDWFCFAMILLGIVVNGVSCFVIGSGVLTFTHPTPAPTSPPGDGLLVTDDGVVVLRGAEGAVNAITRGRFMLRFKSENEYNDIGASAILLIIQFIAQLLLIPQGTLFGQLMFLASLAVSWAYSLFLSAIDKSDLQIGILLSIMECPPLYRFILGTRTSMAVFAALALQHPNPTELFEQLIPNKTETWKTWRRIVAQKIKDGKELVFDESDWKFDQMSENDQKLLKTLYSDAEEAYNGYIKYLADKMPSNV